MLVIAWNGSEDKVLPRIILLLIILLAAVYAIYRYRRLPPEEKKKMLKWLVIGVGGVVLLTMVATGRLSWLFAALGALLAVVPRLVNMAISFGPTVLPFLKRYQQNKQSNMQTDYVKLQMNLLTGELQGEVLQGEFAGRNLQQMTLQELQQLQTWLKQQDGESAALLAAYLNRVHPGWAGENEAGQQYAYDSSDMSLKEAREILGLEENASKDDIVKAHKRLMQKLHPDRGGSDYLAQQINRAKDVLIKNLS